MKNVKLVSDTISKNDIEKLVTWMSQDDIPQLTKGPLTIKFQDDFSNFLGEDLRSCFINSGSSAILLSLLALKIKNNIKKVVVPSVSWATDLSSPMVLGLETILCDCNLQDLSLDLYKLEKIFEEESPEVCILVSVLGLVPDMERIMSLCKKYNVILLEDVCESLGSKYKGDYLGTFGLMSFFSFYYGHHISTIEGGMITTEDKNMHDILVSIRNHGWDRDWSEDLKKEYREKYGIDSFSSMYAFYFPGLNLRSTDLQAFLGINQIEKIEPFSSVRNRNFLKYSELIKENYLNVNQRDGDFVSNFAYPVVHSERDSIIAKIKEHNIEVRPLIAGSMAKQPFATGVNKKYGTGNSDIIHEKGFYLPNHQDLSLEQVEFIASLVNSEKNNLK
jgi:CDP-4-dehydro-6-deoxyglucose reductase, E1